MKNESFRVLIECLKKKDNSPSNASLAHSELFKRTYTDLLQYCKKCASKSKIIRRSYNEDDLLIDAWLRFKHYIKKFNFNVNYKSEQDDRKKLIGYFRTLISNLWIDEVYRVLPELRKKKGKNNNEGVYSADEAMIKEHILTTVPDVKIYQNPRNKSQFIIKYSNKGPIKITQKEFMQAFDQLNEKKQEIIWEYAENYPNPMSKDQYSRLNNKFGLKNNSIIRSRIRASEEVKGKIPGIDVDKKQRKKVFYKGTQKLKN